MEGTGHRPVASLAVAAVLVLAASACASDVETEVADESETEAAELLAAAGSRLSGRSLRGHAPLDFDEGESRFHEGERGRAGTLTSSFESDAEGHVSVVVALEQAADAPLPDGGEIEVRYLESRAYLRLAKPVESDGVEVWYTGEPALLRGPSVGQFFGLEGPVGGLMCLLPHFTSGLAEDCNPLGDTAALLELASRVTIQPGETGRTEEIARVAFVLSLEELFPPVARMRSSVMEEWPESLERDEFLDWLGSDVEAEAWIDDTGHLQRLVLDLSPLMGDSTYEPDSGWQMTLSIDFYDPGATDIAVYRPSHVVYQPSHVVDGRSTDLTVEAYGRDSVLPPETSVAVAVPESSVAEQQAECPAADGSSGPVIDFAGPPVMCIDPDARYVATFETSEGEMRFELHADRTPLTVNNFVVLALWGYYDGTLLFRTDPSIDIIQGGSPHTNSPSDPGPGYTISDEPAFGADPSTGQVVGPYRYQPGQLAMARAAGHDSAGAQFFITTGPNSARLDSQGTYVVFGSTDDAGLAVAQSIIGLHTSGGRFGGAPARDVVVHSVTIEGPVVK